MPHIHTKPGQHDITASAFIIRMDNGQPKLLMHRHKTLGIMLQPGGHVELDENPWQAVLHEISEETGYKPSQLKLLQPVDAILKLDGAEVVPAPICINAHRFSPELDHTHTDISFGFITSELPLNVPDEGESHEFYWRTRDEFDDEAKVGDVSNVRGIARHVFDVCLPKWKHITIDDDGNMTA